MSDTIKWVDRLIANTLQTCSDAEKEQCRQYLIAFATGSTVAYPFSYEPREVPRLDVNQDRACTLQNGLVVKHHIAASVERPAMSADLLYACNARPIESLLCQDKSLQHYRGTLKYFVPFAFILRKHDPALTQRLVTSLLSRLGISYKQSRIVLEMGLSFGYIKEIANSLLSVLPVQEFWGLKTHGGDDDGIWFDVNFEAPVGREWNVHVCIDVFVVAKGKTFGFFLVPIDNLGWKVMGPTECPLKTEQLLPAVETYRGYEMTRAGLAAIFLPRLVTRIVMGKKQRPSSVIVHDSDRDMWKESIESLLSRPWNQVVQKEEHAVAATAELPSVEVRLSQLEAFKKDAEYQIRLLRHQVQLLTRAPQDPAKVVEVKRPIDKLNDAFIEQGQDQERPWWRRKNKMSMIPQQLTLVERAQRAHPQIVFDAHGHLRWIE